MPYAQTLALLAVLSLAAAVLAAEPPARDTSRGDRLAAEHFRRETERLEAQSLADVKTLADWTARRDEERRRLFEMLGLWPLPDRTDLRAEITGKLDHPEFTVEKVQFQSRPGLYVTGNLYLPKNGTAPAPAVLYVCGHGNNKKDGVSYGSKSFYQHHGAWLARNGYVCLTIDTLQLGEIEGLHHGTYREGMWWWWDRGYTPAGVEAWNGIRALDYLQSRPEVDRERLGITGRSGGGAYSWWVAALDERVKAAVPVAGITDLRNHVIDGVVEGHCDCMFQVNTYRWDYAQVAALVAPRPLLISNTDKDPIFPLDGVVRLHAKVRRLYDLHKAGDKLGLLITEGPHKDTQDLQVPAIRWFDRFLKETDRPIETAAAKLFAPEDLKVYAKLPTDQQNTRIHEVFVPSAAPDVPPSADAWKTQRDAWLSELRAKSFRGWPEEGAPLDLKPAFSAARQGVRLRAWDFTTQEGLPLRLYLAHREGLERPELAVLNVLDEAGWNRFLAGMRPAFEAELKDEALPPADEKEFAETQGMFRSFKWAMAYLAPRGIGSTAWTAEPKKEAQIRRRFALLGQTPDGMRVWDTRRALQALRAVKETRETPLWLQAHGPMAGVALYASLFEPGVARLDLWSLPRSHRDGPHFLNVQRFMDLPQAVTMAAERSQVILYGAQPEDWEYSTAVSRALSWDEKRLQFRRAPERKP